MTNRGNAGDGWGYGDAQGGQVREGYSSGEADGCSWHGGNGNGDGLASGGGYTSGSGYAVGYGRGWAEEGLPEEEDAEGGRPTCQIG